MPTYRRSGRNLTTGKLGRVKCLRQEFLLPGERMHCRVDGRIRMGALREQETLPVHVHLEAYLVPVRWLDPNWTDYVTQGPNGNVTLTTQVIPTNVHGLRLLGVGPVGNDVIWQIWSGNYLRVYNEYFKWPQDADSGLPSASDNDGGRYGLRAVNLESWWTRFIDQAGLSDSDFYLDTEAGSGGREKFSVQDLARKSADLRIEMEEEYLTSNRYKEFLNAMWNSAGSNEVDQVPISLGFERGYMGASNLWATDAAGLGTIAGVHEFNVNHDFGVVTAPEHCVLSYFLVLRAPPMLEEQGMPFTAIEDMDWAEITGQADVLANAAPKEWKERQIIPNLEGQNVLGYAPAGHQWRSGWDNVDQDVDERNSFMTMDQSDLPNWRYHQDLDRAFISTQLGHYLCNLEFNQMSSSPIPLPMASVMAGASI